MAISEELCWEVLEMTKGKSIPRSWLKGSPTDEPPFENSLPLIAIEHDLVLRHSKAQIEDSLYFLRKRGYLFQHGHVGLTRVLYQLSPKALNALEARQFDKEEQAAFRDAMFDVKTPGWLGMKINLGEMWRRFKKNIRAMTKKQVTPNKVLQLTRYSALFQSADIFTLPKRAVTSS